MITRLIEMYKESWPQLLTYCGKYSEGAAAKEPMQLFTKNIGLC